MVAVVQPGAAVHRRARVVSDPGVNRVPTPAASGGDLGWSQDHLGNECIGHSLADPDGGLAEVVTADLLCCIAGIHHAALRSSPSAVREAMRHGAEAPLDLDRASRLAGASGSHALAPATAERFGAAFGHDFTHVRVHTDGAAAAAAEALQARAFALGAELFVARGAFSPGTTRVDRLLLHELTHVVQHDRGELSGRSGVSDPGERHEVEAYANEERLAPALTTAGAAVEAALRGLIAANGGEPLPPAVA